MKKTVLLLFILSFFSGLLCANVVILNNRRQINVKSYRVEGDLVYITLEDGLVYSIRKETVDLDLTRRANEALARKQSAVGGEQDDGPKTLVEVAGEAKSRREQLEQKTRQDEKVASRYPTERVRAQAQAGASSSKEEIPEVVFPEGEGPDKPILLFPTVDLYVDENRNRAVDEPDLRLSGTLKHNRRILMKFNIKYLKNVDIKEAKLRFYVFEPLQSPGRIYVKAAMPNRNWDAYSIDSYKKSPDSAVDGYGTSITQQEGWYDINVTDLLKTEMDKGENYGFLIYTRENDFVRIYGTETNHVDKRPYLAINFRKPPPENTSLASGNMTRPYTPTSVLMDFIERSSLLFAFIVSLVPALAIFFVSSRWLNKTYSLLLSLGILVAAFVSVILSLKLSP